MPFVNLDMGVWEDELGKHIRFAITDLGVAITLDLTHETDEQAIEDQAVATMGLLANLPELVQVALEGAGVVPDE
jgi:hypothetical protein